MLSSKEMSELDTIEDILKKKEIKKAFEFIEDKDKNSLAEEVLFS
jgi:hypothetical protein